MTDSNQTPPPERREYLFRFIPIPDVRAVAMAAGVALVFYILSMIKAKPELLHDAGFMQFATLVVSGTIILVYQNLFGGTKGSTETSQTLAKSVAATAAIPVAAPTVVVAPVPANPAPVGDMNVTADTVNVDKT